MLSQLVATAAASEDTSSNATSLCDLVGGPGNTRHRVAPQELRKPLGPQLGVGGRGGQDTPFPYLLACPRWPAPSHNLFLSDGAPLHLSFHRGTCPHFLEHGWRNGCQET